MSRWEMVPIEDCCDILDSQRIPITASERKAGIYPYYGANGVQDYVADYIFDDELVLLAEDGGYFGSKEKPIAYRVSGKCWINNHAHILRPKARTDVDYLCFSLMFYDVGKLINGTTRKKLNQAEMRKMLIPHPPIEIQRAVAATLDQAATLIALRKQQIEKLDLLVKARFTEMFGDTLNDSAIALSEVCSIITDGTHQSPRFVHAGIPFLFVSNIVEYEIDYQTTKFIAREEYQTLIKRTPVEIGDILLTTVGSYGNPAIVKTDNEFCFQRHIAYLKPKKNMIDSQYMHSVILSQCVQMQIDQKVKGVAQKTLNLSELKTIRLNIPPLSLQQAFAAFVSQVESQKQTLKRAQAKLQRQYDALMQEYFS